MAYGRDAQAEEILVDALKNDPTRLAIHLKLLEIYSARKSVKQFEAIANDLYGQTGGVGPDWEKAVAMGQVLDPGNALYAGGEAPAAPVEEPKLAALAATTVILPPGELQKVRDTMTMPGQFAQIASAADAAAAPLPLDFELDQTLPGVPLPASSQAAEAPAGLDFDLDLDLPEAVPAVQSVAAQEPHDLDIDLSLPDLAPKPAAATAATALASPVAETVTATSVDDGLDFEFDLDTPAAHVEPAGHERIDLSAIDLDLDRPAAGARGGASVAAVPYRPAPLPPAGSAGEDDNPDVTTKLELAQAYEEMGDKEGARELLQEVLNEGSGRQQELARGKLAALDI
jgi:pilus assembly protein FimV